MKATCLTLVFLAVAMSGCSTAVSPEKSAKIDMQKTGLVLATLNWTATPEDSVRLKMEFLLQPVEHPDRMLTAPSITSEKNLWLVALPPGRYQLADWFNSAYSGPKTALTPFYFEVKAGRVTYLGNLQVKVTSFKNQRGRVYGSIVRPTLENHFAAAVGDFHQQYPALASVPIDDVAPAKFDLFPAGTSRTAMRGGPRNDYYSYPSAAAPQPSAASNSSYSSVTGVAPSPH